jgi:GTPase Era involved in 16S rRNA processing
VLGDTKAGKSTLLNKLIGKKILGTNEMRATAAKWTIEFHREKNYKLHVYKEDRDEIKK